MPEYYPYDCANRLTIGQFNVDSDFREYPLRVSGEDSIRDVISTTREFFPQGWSQHGKSYLLNREILHRHAIDNRQETTASIEATIELIFELVRRIETPQLPSRYCSLFCCKTAADASQFKTNYRHRFPNGKTYLIRTEQEVFVADMNLLRLGESSIEAWTNARKYWRGQYTNTPQLEVLIPNQFEVVREYYSEIQTDQIR